MNTTAMVHSISDYLIGRIPEISFLLATMFMIFVSDLIMGRLFLKRLRKMSFLSRTFAFVLFWLVAMPGLTILSAMLLKSVLLGPMKNWIIIDLAVAFLFTGILLCLKYNMKIK